MNTDILENLGLNIFAAVQTSKLPNDILDFFIDQNIPFDQWDTLCMIGHGGTKLWNHLPHPLVKEKDPIDHFCIEQMKKLDEQALILFPNSDLNIPLQRIGRFLNIGRPTPMGIDIHKDFGLWFAYRGVFLTRLKIDKSIPEDFISPCEGCETKACLNASALGVDVYLGRNACPFKTEHRYGAEQLEYHRFKGRF